MSGLTRRRLLGAAAGATAGGAFGAGYLARGSGGGSDDDAAPAVVAFHGEHQAGIATPAQDRLVFAAFDLDADSSPGELRDLLREWTDAAARMTVGAPAGPHNNSQPAPPDDTGEALGLPPSRLTVTLGLGPSLFDTHRGLGLASKRPAVLRDLPHLPGDALDPDRSGGDLCVQACADDPQVDFHAVRNLARLGRGSVVMRWCQLGFGRTSTTSRAQSTPRNLMGFKDGTNNIRAEDTAEMNRHVWVGPSDSPAWMRGGTYLVARRIRMHIEAWDRAALEEQEQTIGRAKESGAPLGARAEFDPVKLARLPADAHVRMAAPSENRGERILRRGYSFTDGLDPDSGQLDAGLFFICFQRDPLRQFVAIQRRLGAHDALNEYIRHTSSAVFAVPPGVRPGGFVADGLFA
jgi:deferrochelatase/peroxidase EfeB